MSEEEKKNVEEVWNQYVYKGLPQDMIKVSPSSSGYVSISSLKMPEKDQNSQNPYGGLPPVKESFDSPPSLKNLVRKWNHFLIHLSKSIFSSPQNPLSLINTSGR
jgi:hypothetical protein